MQQMIEENKIDELNLFIKEIRTGYYTQEEQEEMVADLGIIDFDTLIKLKHKNILFYMNKSDYVARVLTDKSPLEKSVMIDVMTKNHNVHRNSTKELFEFIYVCLDYDFDSADINKLVSTYCKVVTVDDVSNINKLISLCKALNYDNLIAELTAASESFEKELINI